MSATCPAGPPNPSNPIFAHTRVASASEIPCDDDIAARAYHAPDTTVSATRWELVDALVERHERERVAVDIEAYFGNLGGDGKRPSALDSALAGRWGSASAWEAQFRQSAQGLAGGSGWVLLVLELDTAALRIVASGNHTQVQATSIPLLVLDMYEHSYHIDFGAAAARYIDAFFANAQWDEVHRRLERANRIAATWRG